MTSDRPAPPASSEPVGLWLVGARGSIGSTVALGLMALRRGLIPPVGLATELDPLCRLGFAAFDQLVLGGCDVRRTKVADGVRELVDEGVVSAAVAAACAADLAELDERLCAGFFGEGDADLSALRSATEDREVARRTALAPRERIAAVREDLDRFRSEHGLSRLVVVNVASTESPPAGDDDWQTTAGFEAALDSGRALPASCLYARAAFEAGAGFVNFTPSLGASIPALREQASRQGLPHCGSDGKTGETLVKTTLAPMFANRALRVLSWQGYNMLGNRDGAVLENPEHKRAKVVGKDEALRSLLPNPDLHSFVGIDYVPSLGDWKTAFDLIHFEGFLGARMNLQFTWTGSDSALAAPLILDLVRFTERELRLGRGGVQKHLAAYFKSPLDGSTHDFHRQFSELQAWCDDELAADRG